MHDHLIENFLQRYPATGHPQTVRDFIAHECNWFVKSNLADSNFAKELCSGSEQKFWSHVSEALLAACLSKSGLAPMCSHGGGPDLLVIENGQKIWIEVICPEPIKLPSDWLAFKPGSAVEVPHEQILLRWTSAIKEKAEKLLGSLDGAIKGYLEKGIVASSDAYVIAVNGCRFRSGPFPELFGISQFPYAVEAVFAVGPYQFTFNRNTLEQIGAGHQHRPLISKPKGKPVPAYIFLNARFKPISAIWAVDVDGTSAIGKREPMAVIHNPNAINKIPVGFLPAHDEYIATPIGAENFKLNRLEGCLRSQ